MECVLSELNRKQTMEIDRLLGENKRWEQNCIAERNAYNSVREKEREWFDKYTMIMCNVAGKNILSANESGFANFQSCIDWFIEEFKAKGSANFNINQQSHGGQSVSQPAPNCLTATSPC